MQKELYVSQTEENDEKEDLEPQTVESSQSDAPVDSFSALYQKERKRLESLSSQYALQISPLRTRVWAFFLSFALSLIFVFLFF